MYWTLRRAGLAALWGTLLAATVVHAAPAVPAGANLPSVVAGTPAAGTPTPGAGELARWALETGNSKGRPFAIVDKKRARLLVFDRRGRLVGASAALLGATVGDDISPGVGLRAQKGIVGLHERTTPAGRFDALPGRNLNGEHVVWADYASAFAIHRLRPGSDLRKRKARLASATPQDNRVSQGCVVVPGAFYDSVVRPVLGTSASVVYVMPETQPLQQVLLDPQRRGPVRQGSTLGADARLKGTL